MVHVYFALQYITCSVCCLQPVNTQSWCRRSRMNAGSQHGIATCMSCHHNTHVLPSQYACLTITIRMSYQCDAYNRCNAHSTAAASQDWLIVLQRQHASRDIHLLGGHHPCNDPTYPTSQGTHARPQGCAATPEEHKGNWQHCSSHKHTQNYAHGVVADAGCTDTHTIRSAHGLRTMPTNL